MTATLEFVRGLIDEKEATTEFENIVTIDPQLASGKILYGYPTFNTGKGTSISPDAVFIAPNGQVTIIHMAKDLPEDYQTSQDNCFMAVYRKLGSHSSMRKGRQMRINIQTLSFVPSLPDSDLSDPDYPVVNRGDLARLLSEYRQRDSEGVDGAQVTTVIMATNSDTGFW